MRAEATKGLFSPGSERAPLRAPHQPSTGDLAQDVDRRQQAAAPPWESRPTAGEQSPHQGQPPLSIYRRQCPMTKGEAQTRKPGGQGLMACPPGLTADTTVFAIGRDTEMKVRMARRQGIASRGCLRSGICCTLALSALGGRLRFVWRCLKSTGASTLSKSPARLKSDSQ